MLDVTPQLLGDKFEYLDHYAVAPIEYSKEIFIFHPAKNLLAPTEMPYCLTQTKFCFYSDIFPCYLASASRFYEPEKLCLLP